MSESKARRWLIQGRVQGVGFRWWVLKRARALGLVGWASNLADGTVEVVAVGTAHALEELEQALRTGPRLARVDSVEKLDIPHEVTPTNSFTVR